MDSGCFVFLISSCIFYKENFPKNWLGKSISKNVFFRDRNKVKFAIAIFQDSLKNNLCFRKNANKKLLCMSFHDVTHTRVRKCSQKKGPSKAAQYIQ